ncbi:asteroid 1 -like protein [Brachionus plicatilis]|uniref:Asteroid 1-like protein n=1 Tax=Brachionus plicatilis TaxID=10195 RepID=A0A3M7SY36_BRAPC|nr:asteroid 1 -like protein [Brachionus plicatilis]
MGIRGLETFIDRIYTSQDREKVFDLLPLSELKLVIDGNQFVYALTSLGKHGHYGGNYDQFYATTKQLLTKLKPSIELVIFDGAKESIGKCRHRLEQRVSRVANLSQDDKPKLSPQDHFMVLREQPSLLNRQILYNLLIELDISYRMCQGAADHVIALYANGHNPAKQTFTVMSKASFFNVYNLQKGYLSSKYAFKIFENLHQMDMAKFPVFRLQKLVHLFRLESHRTWIYFCIMLGNNDDPELKRNTLYFKEYKINTSGGCMDHLIAHLKLEEKILLETNFGRVRSSYVFKHDTALKKIDQLIELFEMKNSEYKFAECLVSSSKIGDFDRLFLTIKSLNCFFINCLVENCQEDSAYQPSIDFIHCIYAYRVD